MRDKWGNDDTCDFRSNFSCDRALFDWMSQNQNQSMYDSQSDKGKKILTRSQRELLVKTSKLPGAQENASGQVAIGFSFESNWLRKWGEFSDQSQNEVKQNQSMYNSQSDKGKKISSGVKENSWWKRANCLERGKTRVAKSRLVLVLNLIGYIL